MSSEREIRETLEELKRELAESPELASEVRQRLTSVIDDVESSLTNRSQPPASDDADEEPDSLSEQLVDTARHIEDSHPTLFNMVGSVIEALSRMGI